MLNNKNCTYRVWSNGDKEACGNIAFVKAGNSYYCIHHAEAELQRLYKLERLIKEFKEKL